MYKDTQANLLSKSDELTHLALHGEGRMGWTTNRCAVSMKGIKQVLQTRDYRIQVNTPNGRSPGRSALTH